MYKVLIVEDEMLVRLGLRNSVNWNKFNMTVVADASDGRTAWEWYVRENPDIVITDLKMPDMDGMALISKIREKDKITRIIVLTCMEEFDLARKAVSLGVSDYMIKLTMTEEEMETVLQKTVHELQLRDNSNPTKPIVQASPHLVKEKLLKDFVFYNIYSAQEFGNYVNELKLRLSPARLILCSMEIDNYKDLEEKFRDEQGQLIKMSLLNILEEILGNCGRGEAFYFDEMHYIVIFSFSDIVSEQAVHQELYGILNRIKEVIGSYFSVSVSFGISSIHNGFPSFGKMYHEALKALEKKFFMGTGLFLSSTSHRSEGEVIEKIDGLKHLPDLSKLLGEQETMKINLKIDSLVNRLPDDKKSFQQFFCELVQWISVALYSNGDHGSALVLDYNRKIQQCDTLVEMIADFNTYVSDALGNSRRKKKLSKEVSMAVQFIANHFGRDISLVQVAEYVNLSSSYLSNLFKKELQVNFIEYLNHVRIERAKELLLGTYLKSYEIADEVGFSEHTYFSKVFKRSTGLSPNEFRKQLMKEWTGDMENEDSIED
ncbi:response regulator [Cohnella sp. NL03-T5]|nr:response regulator [Cohnella silvisoli]